MKKVVVRMWIPNEVELSDVAHKFLTEGYEIIEMSETVDEYFEETWQKRLEAMLHELGVGYNLWGYIYITEIMEFLSHHPKEKILINDMYKSPMKLHGKSYYQVEKNIRYMVKAIWRNNSIEKITKVLGTRPVTYGTLRNSMFISILRRKLFDS